MRVKATRVEIRALVSLAELDGQARERERPDPSLGQRRAAARKEVPAVVLERYDVLFARGRGPAVATVNEGCCSACHLRLPAVLDYEIRKAPGIFTCPHCRRMLYGPDHLRETSRHPARSGSAALPPAPPLAVKR